MSAAASLWQLLRIATGPEPLCLRYSGANFAASSPRRRAGPNPTFESRARKSRTLWMDPAQSSFITTTNGASSESTASCAPTFSTSSTNRRTTAIHAWASYSSGRTNSGGPSKLSISSRLAICQGYHAHRGVRTHQRFPAGSLRARLSRPRFYCLCAPPHQSTSRFGSAARRAGPGALAAAALG